ncbi:hypothetical protein SDJN02_16301, partial [Cucurbita argyrosperma subsp. argyrosperma]
NTTLELQIGELRASNLPPFSFSPPLSLRHLSSAIALTPRHGFCSATDELCRSTFLKVRVCKIYYIL